MSTGHNTDHRIRMGMIGGGQGAFIGAVHRIAARLDDRYILVAGALSSDEERARASAVELGIPPDRAYGSFPEMLEQESRRPDRVDVVTIVTPNHMHFPIAKMALEKGFHVVCDKPLTTTGAEARELVDLVQETGLIFCVTYNYSGYPLIRQAQGMIGRGMLGNVRVVQVEYAQAWLTEALERSGQKQASWRTDPLQSGVGGCVGDIGTHAFHLSTFVTGLRPKSLLSDLSTFVLGRKLDDNAHILLRFEGGAKGMLWASQVAPGNENALRLRVFGDKGALEWAQENPNELWFTPVNDTKRKITRSGDGAMDEAARLTRVPSGHPEGYLEAFGNVYAEVARAILARKSGRLVDPTVAFPLVEDGMSGVNFIEAAVKSSTAGGVWVDL